MGSAGPATHEKQYSEVGNIGYYPLLHIIISPPLTVAKPFGDWLQQVAACSGEPDRSPVAFLAQFYLYAQQTVLRSSGPANRQESSLALPKTGTPTRSPATRQGPPSHRSHWGCARHFAKSMQALGPSAPCNMSRPNRPKAGLSSSWPSTSVRSRRSSIGLPGMQAPRNTASVCCQRPSTDSKPAPPVPNGHAWPAPGRPQTGSSSQHLLLLTGC